MPLINTLQLCWDNFVYQIGQLTPTDTRIVKAPEFIYIEPHRLFFNQQESLGERHFSVVFGGSGEENILREDLISDPRDDQTVAELEYIVDVGYSKKHKQEDIHLAMLQDRHDIENRLRNPRFYNGVNARHDDLNFGLHLRVRERDELIADDPATWIYRSTWRCTQVMAQLRIRPAPFRLFIEPSSTEDDPSTQVEQGGTLDNLNVVVTGTAPSVTWTLRQDVNRNAVGTVIHSATTTSLSGDTLTPTGPVIPNGVHVWLEISAIAGAVKSISFTGNFD